MKLKLTLMVMMIFSSFNIYSIPDQKLKSKIREATFFLKTLNYHFDYKKTALRPKSCPLESKKNANIASALSDLKTALDKKCQSKNQALISNLNTSINDLNDTYVSEVESGKRFEGHTKENDKHIASQERIALVSKSLSTFSR